MSKPKKTILITGFGPFPGTPDNPSERLVKNLSSDQGMKGVAGATVIFGLLPTHWQKVKPALNKLFDQYSPDIALHLGYTDISPGFRLESAAYNQTCGEPDVKGVCGSCGPIIEQHPSSLTTSAPLKMIHRCLSAAGLGVTLSDDPGRYLCNMAYYLSLSHARANPCLSLFIHIPAINTGKGLIPKNHQGDHRLSLDEAQKGMELILACCIEEVHALGARASCAHRGRG